MFVGLAALGAALEALVALALMLSRTLSLISLALELRLSSTLEGPGNQSNGNAAATREAIYKLNKFLPGSNPRFKATI